MIKKLLCILFFPAAAVYCVTYNIAFTVPADINGDTNIYPGKTNIPVFRFRGVNSAGSSNGTFPHLYNVDFFKTGLNSIYFQNTRFYYDEDGVFGTADDKEASTAYQCKPGTFFDRNYSPNNFGSDNWCYMGPDLNIFIDNGQTNFFYLTVTMNTNLPDRTAFNVNIPANCIWNYAGHDWIVSGNLNQTKVNPGEFRTRVVASRLEISGIPSITEKNTLFPVRVQAVDDYGNRDLDYTNGIFFYLTNVSPTIYSAGMGSVVNHSGNPVILNSSNTFNNQCAISNSGIYRLVVCATNTNITAGQSAVILVEPEIHHFTASDELGQTIGSRVYQAGEPLSAQGSAAVYIYARDYVGNVLSNYSGHVVLGTDSREKFYYLPWDNNPLTQPTTNSPDRTAFNGSSGMIYIPGSNIIFYRSGSFMFYVYDETNNIKSDFAVTVVPGRPAVFSLSMREDFKMNELMEMEFSVYDLYTNFTETYNGAFTLQFSDRQSGALFEGYAVYGALQISKGRFSSGVNNGIKIFTPGEYTVKGFLNGDSRVYFEKNITVSLTVDRKKTVIAGRTYINPSSPERTIPVFGKNDNTEYTTVRIKIYSARGILIKEFYEQRLYSGVHELAPWDLTDNSGREVPSGLYFIVINGDKISSSMEKVVIVK
ncbi:MAG TPA: hypothetical protein DC049_18165 [Spirochaetia bacterium]|nr:hypothetical protein [Spirochaetia bacterium]